MRPVPALAILALALIPCVACSTLSPKITPRWIDEEVETGSEQVLWEVVLMTLDREGYPIGSGANPAKREVETSWREVLQPFRGRGFRERATVRLEPLPERRYRVRVRVERETNESLRPTDPVHAEWKPAADDEGAAQRLMQYIRAFMGGGSFEVGEPKRREPR